MHCVPKMAAEAHTSTQTPVPRRQKCLYTELRQIDSSDVNYINNNITVYFIQIQEQKS